MRHFRPFVSNFKKCRLEAADDVMFGVAEQQTGVDVRAKFGDSPLNSGRIIRFFVPATPVLRTFMQYLIAFCRRPEQAGDVISGIFVRSLVPDR